MKTYVIVAIIFGILSLITFIAYIIDKFKAVNGKWRIPEKVLLLLSFFGGGIGGYIAMFLARHKTRKAYFHIVNILGICVQVATVVCLAIFVK